jgi:hypothetical protein
MAWVGGPSAGPPGCRRPTRLSCGRVVLVTGVCEYRVTATGRIDGTGMMTDARDVPERPTKERGHRRAHCLWRATTTSPVAATASGRHSRPGGSAGFRLPRANPARTVGPSRLTGPPADVLAGRRGSPRPTLRGPGKPLVTDVQRIPEIEINCSCHGMIPARLGPPQRHRHSRWPTAPSMPFRSLRLGIRGLSRPNVPGGFDATRSCLCVQPLARAVDLPFVGDMSTARGVVGLGSAAPADRHPSICLGRMVFIEPGPHGRCFGRDHDSPHRRPIMADAKPEGSQHARASEFRPSLHPTSHSGTSRTPDPACGPTVARDPEIQAAEGRRR